MSDGYDLLECIECGLMLTEEEHATFDECPGCGGSMDIVEDDEKDDLHAE